MGSGQSRARTVSVDNDSPAGIIDVSEDVVQRLKSNLAKEKATRDPPKQTQPSPQSAPSSYPAAQQIPTIIYQGAEPTITAIQVRKEKEAELRANDEYWSKRLQAQEADFLKNGKIMEQEFTQTITEVKQRFQQPSQKNVLPPCQDLKAKVVDCYKNNPAETLKCTAEVKEFLNCINFHRLQNLDEKVK